MFTPLTAFLSMLPLDGLVFILGGTSSLCAEERVRTIFFPLTKMRILEQITISFTLNYILICETHISQQTTENCILKVIMQKHKLIQNPDDGDGNGSQNFGRIM